MSPPSQLPRTPVPPATTTRATPVPMTATAPPRTCVSPTTHASTPSPYLSQSCYLPGMRLNCLRDLLGIRLNYPKDLLSRRLNCLVASLAKALLSRRLNCSPATSATNPCVAQHARCCASRLASPLQHLAAALQIRACYGPGPHSSEEAPPAPHSLMA